MGIGVSIILLAIGAILTFAVDFTAAGVDIDIVGWILMAVGAIGLVWSLIAMGTTGTRRDVVVEREDHTHRV